MTWGWIAIRWVIFENFGFFKSRKLAQIGLNKEYFDILRPLGTCYNEGKHRKKNPTYLVLNGSKLHTAPLLPESYPESIFSCFLFTFYVILTEIIQSMLICSFSRIFMPKTLKIPPPLRGRCAIAPRAMKYCDQPIAPRALIGHLDAIKNSSTNQARF